MSEMVFDDFDYDRERCLDCGEEYDSSEYNYCPSCHKDGTGIQPEYTETQKDIIGALQMEEKKCMKEECTNFSSDINYCTIGDDFCIRDVLGKNHLRPKDYFKPIQLKMRK